MLQLAVTMGVFTTIVVLLAALVLTVRQWLTQREQVTITINKQQTLEVTSSDTLLTTLRTQGIELPAACGGRGTCGQCRFVLHGDAGTLSPTEANHINRRDALVGTHLACMVKVQGDMDIQLPESALQAHRYACRVVSNDNVSTYLKTLVLEITSGDEFKFQAGDYILLEAPAGAVEFAGFNISSQYEEEWRRQRLRNLAVTIPQRTVRAYSLANPPTGDPSIMLVVRIALPPAGAMTEVPPGMVSSYVFSLKEGDTVGVSGPFGDFHAAMPSTDREMIFIGGGVGIAPLRSIILDQLINHGSRRRMSLWYGSRNLRELCFAEEFTSLAARHDNFTYHVALSEPESDEWSGSTGFIHNVVFENLLREHPDPESAEYYLCGPPLMSAATLAMLEDIGVDSASIHFDDFGGTHGS